MNASSVPAGRNAPAGKVSVNASLPERILVPIDFSDHSKRALAYAASVAVSFSAELLLLYVVEPAIYPADLGFGQVSLPNLEKELSDRGYVELNDLAKMQAGSVRNVKTLVKTGRPFIEILETARTEKIDLIVIATHGHTGMEHFLFGSTTEKVVKKAHCPVLLVRPVLYP
jgi:nucleotide-binding universal stress UspA family protein